MVYSVLVHGDSAPPAIWPGHASGIGLQHGTARSRHQPLPASSQTEWRCLHLLLTPLCSRYVPI